MKRRRPNRAGFTLIEAIATITVVAILGSVSSSIIYTGITAYRDAAAHAQLHAEVATALEVVTRALREVPARDEGGALVPDISAVTATSIAWGSSSIARSGGQLQLVSDAGTSTLLTDVASFEIRCFDSFGAALPQSLSAATAGQVQRIQITITASRQGVSETLRSRIFIRSLMAGATP